MKRENCTPKDEEDRLRDQGNKLAVPESTLQPGRREPAEQPFTLVNFALNRVQEAAFLTDEHACFLYVNDAACRLLEYTREELLQLGVADIDPDFPLDRWSEHWNDLKRQHSLNVESRHRTKTGRLVPVEINANYFEFEGRDYNLALVRDITERKQAEESLRHLNRELRAISNCNQVLVRAEDEQSLLKEVCRIVCEEAGYRMAWAGFAEPDPARTVRPVAWAGVEEGYLALANVTWADTERGHGPTGTAIRTGEPACVQDFAVEPHFDPWRQNALQRGYRSCIALPLKDAAGQTFGVFGIYSKEINAFTPTEIRLLEELSTDLSYGITVLRARVRLQRAEQERATHLRFLEALDQVNRAVQGASDLHQMMRDVLDVVLALFECDRAFLVYPCDPLSAFWEAPMERTRVEYPGILELGLKLPMTGEVAGTLRMLLAADGPVQFGAGTDHPLAPDLCQRFQIQSFMAMAIHPKVGQPWQFGLHQCSRPRCWTPAEVQLFREIGRRLADALTSFVYFRNLRTREEEFRALVENAPDPIVRYDAGCSRLYINPAVERLSRQTSGTLLGTTPLQRPLTPPGQREKIIEAVKRVFQSGRPHENEVEFISPDGQWFCFFNRYVPEMGLDGKVASVLSISSDITRRKQMEDALRSREEDFRALVENSPDTITRYDSTCRRVYVNPAMLALLGRPADEILGRMPESFSTDAQEYMKHLREVLATGREWQGEVACQDPQSEAHRIHLRVVPEFGPGRKVVSALAIGRDITESHRMAAQLRQAQKLEAIGQLAGGVAHDFNNMLAAILLHIGLLRTDPELPPSMVEVLQELEEDARRATSLPRQLLMFSRRQAMQPKPVAIEEVVESMLKMLRRLIGETIEIEFIPGARTGHVFADQGMIEQVVMNLCVNARDAMPEGGRITLTTRLVDIQEDHPRKVAEARMGRFICFQVTDTGCGMDAATLSHIFEPFFTTKDLGRGTGLGLATVFGIVKQHQGWIEVESTVGQGATFSIFLPEHAQPVPAPGKPGGKAFAGGSETILLVEDEGSLRRVIAAMMRRCGFQVLEAGDGMEAVRMWEQHGPGIDLLFSDMVMPGGQSGLELATRFRVFKPGLKVILTSGYNTESRMNPGLEKNITCLPKPFLWENLAKTLRETLDAKE